MNPANVAQLAERLTAHIADPLERAEVLDALDLDAVAIAAWADHGPDWLDADDLELWRIAARQLAGPRSSTPCPDWCELQPGHSYSDGDDHALIRHHQTTAMTVGPLYVQIVQRENAVSPAGPIVLDVPSAEVWSEDDSAPWSADQLRVASAALTVAADRLSQLRPRPTETTDDTP